ncbi:MAG: lamin tail domain-containing protein [Myxococcales bacterium]|nr:lamin tail domain-containing protein [Myxococcales bacterium]
MSRPRKVGPSFVAAIPLLALFGVSAAMGCSGTREMDSEQAASALTVSPDLVISQVYGGGGNTGAQYTNDFVELFNRGGSSVSLSGKSLQYASSSGNFQSGANTVALPNATVAPGAYFLIQLGKGAATAAALPTPDHITTGTEALNIAGANGKLVVVDSAALLNCGTTGNCASGAWIDLVGYGTATQAEGTPAPAAGNTTAAVRKGAGCTDTGVNSADFESLAPNPRNSATTAVDCGNPPVDAGPAPDTGSPTPDGGTPSLVLLNEVKINPPGNTDSPWEYAEILCTPNASLDGYSFVAFEGDGDSATGSPGTADVVVDLSGQNCGANGLVYLKAAAGGAPALSAQTKVITVPFLDTGSSPFENATTSFVIVKSGSPLVQGTDYDTDNNGALELPGSGSVIDGVATFDQSDAAVDVTYAPRLTGNLLSDAATRVPGDETPMNLGSWYYGDLSGTTGDSVAYDPTRTGPNFPSDGQLTPGAPNVGTGPIISADGGIITPSDAGAPKSDAGKKDSGGAPVDEEDAGSAASGDGGKKDAGKASTTPSESGSATPPAASGCSATGGAETSGLLGYVGMALAALSALGRRRRKG